MAKGQMKPAKEAKKPKKNAAAKRKAATTSTFAPPELSVAKGKPKKT